MSHNVELNQIQKAVLTSFDEGYVELTHDWGGHGLPPVSFKGRGRGAFKLRAPKRGEYALNSRYYIDVQGKVVFVFDTANCSDVHVDATGIYLAGSFNGWQDAIGDERWLMRPRVILGRSVLALAVKPEVFADGGDVLFKFVTEDHHWFQVDTSAASAVVDDENNWNFKYDPAKTGRHLFQFKLSQPVELSENNRLLCASKEGDPQLVDLEPGNFFYELRSDKELGAIVEGKKTVFRLFAPRAKWVEVGLMKTISEDGPDNWISLERREDFVWEIELSENLSGSYYWFRLDGPEGATSLFDPSVNVLDPYAKAVVSREGPAIVICLLYTSDAADE